LLRQTGNGQWQLATYPEAFLSTSPNVWNPMDLSPETQITIKRHQRLFYYAEKEQDETTTPLPKEQDEEQPYYQSTDFYRKCQSYVAKVVETALANGKLCSRPPTRRDSNSNNHDDDDGTSTSTSCTQPQFEIFSADFIMDTSHQVYLIECNFTPVLYDPEFVEHQIHTQGKVMEDILTTNGLRAYHALYKTDPQALQVNDHIMIRDTMSIVLGEDTIADNDAWNKTKWDLVQTWESD
jgi:hypothetical protein